MRFLFLAVGILTAAASFGSHHAEAADLKLRIATEGTYKPMSYFDSAGKLTGFEVELVTAICAKIDAECEFITMDFDGMLPSLQEKKIDGIASGLRITEKRKKIMDFADKYYTPYAQFVTCRHLDQKDTSPEAMKGFVIGTQSSSSNADLLNAEYAGTATIRLYKTMDEAYLDVVTGRLDAVISNAFVGYDFVHSEKGKGCAFIGDKEVDPKYFGDGTAIGVRKGDDATRLKLNEGIKAIMADGTYEKINAKYWPFSVK